MNKKNEAVKRIRKKMIEMGDNGSSGDETGETIGVLNKELEDLRIKNKKNNDTIRAKNKTLKEAEEAKKMLAQNLADSTTKLQEARNKGVKIEAHLVRFSKIEEKSESYLETLETTSITLVSV